jgi:general stress protein 26
MHGDVPGRIGMTIVMLVMVCLVGVAMARAAFAPDVAEALKTSKEIYVATERADGSLIKVVPIWFMVDGDTVYTTSAPEAHKVKRIQRGSPLHVWVGRPDGPSFVSKAKILKDPELAARMAPVYNQKYWIAWMGFFRPNPDRVRSGKTVIIEIPSP